MKVKLLTSSGNIPSYATNHSAGVDIVATEVSKSGNKIFPLYTYKTGLKMEIPNGYFGLLTARSSISKTLMRMAGSVGIIDSDYRGEIQVRMRGFLWFKPYKVGDRVAQLILLRKQVFEFELADSLSETERGEGGFGSTGK